MVKGKNGGKRIDLLQGTLDMLILQTLRWGPLHGYGIGQAIRAGSGDLLQAETGSLYPAVHRLEKRGWVKSDWGVTENNQRAKYYRLTAAGRRRLQQSTRGWNEMADIIGAILEAEPEKA